MDPHSLRRYALCFSLFLSVLLTAGQSSAEDAAFRVRFGFRDKEPSKWDGSAAVSGGKLVTVEGWRFERTDTMTGPDSWKATSRPITVRRSRSNNKLRAGGNTKPIRVPMTDNGVVIRVAEASADTKVKVQFPQGEIAFSPDEVPLGKPLPRLIGAVRVERVADGEAITAEQTDDDFPSLAIGKNGVWHVAWTSFSPGLERDTRAVNRYTEAPEDFAFLGTPTGGDQVWMRTRRDGVWGEPVAVSEACRDVFKTAIAEDGKGNVWVIWSERIDDAFNVWARAFDPDGQAGEPFKVSMKPGNHHSPVATTDADGRVWIAWQGASTDGREFGIFCRHQQEDGWSKLIPISDPDLDANCWSPAITAMTGSGVAIAWDTYSAGDYDVWLRQCSAKGQWKDAIPVANTPNHEARPALACDGDGRLWVAWELGGPSWGKDWGAYDREDGIALYKARQIGLRVLENGQWKRPAAPLTAALPAKPNQAGWINLPNLTKGKGKGKGKSGKSQGGGKGKNKADPSRESGEEAEAPPGVLNNLARIAADAQGRIWLLGRSRQGKFHTPLGGVWMNYAACLSGDKWLGPILIPHSDNKLYNQPAVAAGADGLVVAHATDHRQNRLAEYMKARQQASLKKLKPKAVKEAKPLRRDPFDNDIYVSTLPNPGETSAPALRDITAARLPAADKPIPEKVKRELAAVARCREHRIDYQDTELRILRGEFHRHTELSGDGMGDGALEDMWRYGMDVARMDWIGNGDHDNGGGREYPWWYTQKTTDVYHLPGSFDPLFTYERSVVYPEGHRNVVFPYRGVRTLPRLPLSDRKIEKPAPDTQMLYRYLHHFDGICASHTCATAMGTDWRDNDPVVEPFVEIYQGARQNYERPGAPRCPTENDSIGGWEPKGFVNLALKRGYRMSFQASSDHGSTHISYCLVYAADASRQAIFDAMKARHTYGATDNIVADLRCRAGEKDHMMGDEFTTAEPPTLRLKLVGASKIAKVTLVKDDEEIQVWEPGKMKVELEWTDPAPKAGETSYYYFRGEQDDTELVWVSPMWIKYQP